MVELSRSAGLKLMTTLGKDTWFVYSALKMFASDGNVNATLTELSDAIGVSEKTVSRHIQTLCGVSVGDQQLLKAERKFGGNVYRLAELVIGHGCPVPSNNLLSDSKDLITAIGHAATEKKMSDTDIIFNYFRDSYSSRYGTDYKVSNFAREKGMTKNLIKKYNGDIETLKAIIDVVMRLFDSKWKSQRFNRPTIGALLSWLAAQAEPFAQANMEQANDELATAEIEAVDGEDLLKQYEQKGWI